jgi:hypothetical protein
MQEEKTPDLSNGLNDLKEFKNIVNEILSPVESLAISLDKMVGSANLLNKNFGLGRSRILEMQRAFADSSVGIAKLGGSLDDVNTTISQIAKASNRNVIENEDVVSKLFAASQVLGISAQDLTENFKNVGYETSQIGVNLENSIQYIQSVGLNAETVMKNVSNNMDKMNRYQFVGGVQGLAKMAAQASMLRIDMSETFRFTDDMLNPEKAINVAAAFQRLGVVAGDLVDPFALFNKSLTDPTGLQNSLARVGQKFISFSKETNSFKINTQGVLILREMEEAAGLTSGTLSKSALAAADLDKRLSQVSFAGLKFKNEEDKQYLANIAKMGEGGKYEVEFNDGTKKDLQNLNQDEFDELIKQQKDAPKTVEDIQRSQLGFLKSIASDMRAILNAGKFGAVSSQPLISNLEGVTNIVKTFSDIGQKKMPKTGEIRKDVTGAIDKMKNLFQDINSNKIDIKDFGSNFDKIKEKFVGGASNLAEESKKIIKEILDETAKSIKGSSDVEKFFRKEITGEELYKKTANLPKIVGQESISRSSIMGTTIGKNTYNKNINQNESVDVNFNFDQKLDRKKIPQTVSKEEIMQILKQYFESDTFKRMIYEYIIQKEKELELRP